MLRNTTYCTFCSGSQHAGRFRKLLFMQHVESSKYKIFMICKSDLLDPWSGDGGQIIMMRDERALCELGHVCS